MSLFRSFLFFFLVLPLATLSSGTITGTSRANETDRLALLAIKLKIKHDPRGVMSSWNESFHFCRWEGVTCGRRHSRVTILDLSSRGLVGSLSPSLGNLTFLRELRLANNSLEGKIPPEIGQLFRLQQLRLDNNSFEGEIPTNLSHCSKLQYLALPGNKLVGSIPHELSSLLKLTTLVIRDNFFAGNIPPFIGNLTSLQRISATENFFQGAIPDTFGQLRNLTFLTFGSNNLSGTIPPSVYNLSLLVVFSLSFNQFHGSLPPGLGVMLPRLQVFALYQNNLTGPIPVSISNCSRLGSLELGMNNFTGKVGINFGDLQYLYFLTLESNSLGSGKHDELDFIASMSNCSNLETIGLTENQFKGVLPVSVGNFSPHLQYLYLSRNLIYGSIPSMIGNVVGLTFLGLSDNQFTGTIPSSIGNLQNLEYLYLQGNYLSGMIPDSLGNLSFLSQLYLSNNRLEGVLPLSLGNWPSLTVLNLSLNNLIGNIPKQLFTFSAPSISLSLAQNQFSGPLPVEIGKLRALAEVDLSENGLSGEIPSSLGDCTSLQNIYFGRNFFQGSIPPSLQSLRGLSELDLSHNNLSGHIPIFLEQFALITLDLSFNNFDGEVPTKGAFANLSVITLVRNNRLCGGVPELHLPNCIIKGSKTHGKLSLALTIVISIGCALVGLVLGLGFLLCWCKKRKDVRQSGSMFKEPFLKVSYARLFKATDRFSSANLIGVGSFGSVYRGILNQEEGFVAVKVLNLQTRGASKSFTAECEAMRNVRHRNLVKIITSCSSADFQGNEFKALIFEFMPNRSLEKWLHPNTERRDGQDSLQHLSLIQRIDIALDVASALDYLHNRCQTPIIHRDLKPSNILLDHDMTAHVGDFGLAKFLPELSNPNQSTSSGIKGTIGYMPPEYGFGCEVSTYGDVYSFGILLLEMLTGKTPTDPMFQDGLNLHKFAQTALPDNIMEIVEPILLCDDEEPTPAAAVINNRSRAKTRDCRECLVSLIKTGVSCSVESPQDRMDINNAIHELNSARSILQRTRD
ncbi:hypothetical protein RJ640_005926 [Escallonia rubra]|uniref:non-specific serine/threonine protein kinase n=1 Tax=Escallonia rubra TaxID=112253 RepID=A0AA88R1F9_9ASTE|nr:hypothetical protein RJ640_005926 [Escallonia rubra]